MAADRRVKKREENRKKYIWCGLGILLILGSGAALLKLVLSRREKGTFVKWPEDPRQRKEEARSELETAGQEPEEAEREAEIAEQEPEIAEQEPEEAEKEPEIAQQEPETIEPEEIPHKKRRKRKFAKYAGGGLYFLLILGICTVPLALLWVRPTQVFAENRTMASLPEIQTLEGVNWNFLTEAGAYFTDHFVLRQEMVSLNAGIRSELFGVSSVNDVVVGENGWLYYAATLDDYQHKNSISERALFNIAHNVALMQEYTEGLGKTFVFTIAPNKNSLYDENMPERLRFQVAEKSDAERLLPWLVRENVNYLDLFEMFGEQEETLYYARDSHWNEKGAVMVYNALLDTCGKQHETYEGIETVQKTDYFGDLGTMLYPVGQEPENRIQYAFENTWHYVEGESVEDPFIRTENEAGEGNLLMYRDSFGNSLLPYMAQTFSQAAFSKQMPYSMNDIESWEPDILIVEKVERHLPTLGKVPPLISAPVRETEKVCVLVEDTAATVHLSEEGGCWKLEGVADAAYMDTDSPVYVEVDDGGGAKMYEAFCVSSSEAQSDSTNDYGYILYVSKTLLEGNTFHVQVMTEQEEAMVVLLREELAVLQEQKDPVGTCQEETEENREEAVEEIETEAAEEEKEITDSEEKRQENEQTEEIQTKTNVKKEQAGKVQTEVQTEREVRPEAAEQTQEETQGEAAGQPETQETAGSQGQSAAEEVSRVYMEDCGTDTGYWVITYSDGHVEYVDD